ncbi:MAG: hypothetical protein D6788_06195, partial [Planctomycetota bacterium]
LFVSDAGDVGIGTTAPQYALHIIGNDATEPAVFVASNNNWRWDIGGGLGDLTIGNDTYGLSVGVATAGAGAGDIRIWPYGGTERIIFGNATDGNIMSITDGNVGVGTTTPSERLHVAGTAQVDDHIDFAPGAGPLITAGHDNIVPKRMWIAHSEAFPDWGIQYRDTASDGLPSDSIEFIAGDPTKPRMSFHFSAAAPPPLFLADSQLDIYNTDGQRTVSLDGDTHGLFQPAAGGALRLYNAAGVWTADLNGDVGGDGALTLSDDAANSSIALRADGANNAGKLSMSLDDGTETVEIVAAETTAQGSQIMLRNASGNPTIEIDGQRTSDAGEIQLFDANGTRTVQIRASENPGEGPDVLLYNMNGQITVQLDADAGGTGEGQVITDVLKINGGADLAERFEVDGRGTDIKPGYVVVIDPDKPGRLLVSTRAYDRTVAGVISGAGGVNPGMVMGHQGTIADGGHPVALTGRVWTWCDTSGGPIRPGDLLTTSDTPGHARRVTDHARAQGAILGKAMSRLDEGTGLVLVLVNLQ